MTNCEAKEEGVFFIDVESYKTEFELSTICFVHDNYFYESIKHK